MNRVEDARWSFLNKDKTSLLKSHTEEAVHKSIHHKELHATSFNLPKIILGAQDGLVNVLGVILGVAAATSSSQMVIVAGLAATFAESVSMGAVAYTSKLAEADYYKSEHDREKWEIENIPQGEKEEIRALYEDYGFRGKILDEIIERITSDKKIWLEVMMQQELKLGPVDRKEAFPASIIVGISALIGSFIPLLSFFFFPIKWSIVLSLIATSIALFGIGFYKAKTTTGKSLWRQGGEMMIIGMLSALVGYFIGSLFKIRVF